MCWIKGSSGLPWWPGSGCKVVIFSLLSSPKVSKMASPKEHLHKWQSGTPDSWRVDSGELSNSWQHQLWKVQPCCLRRRGYLWSEFTVDAFKPTLPCRHFVRTGSSIAMDVADEDVEAGVSPKGNDSHNCSHGCLIGLPAASFGCKPFLYPRPTGQGTHSIFRAVPAHCIHKLRWSMGVFIYLFGLKSLALPWNT